MAVVSPSRKMRECLSTDWPHIPPTQFVRASALDAAGGMEQLLVNMYKYMHDFKQILDTSAPGDMDMLCSQYPHFYRLAKLMEQIAEGTAAGAFDDVLGKKR